MRRLLFSIVTAFTLAWATLAMADVQCGEPCVIQSSPGGNVLEFRLQGLHLLYLHTPIIVDGPCYSACTTLIDVAHADVCLTTRAILGYHQMYWKDDADKLQYAPISYETPGLADYIASRGGLPANKDDLMIVPFEQAKAFYKACPGADQ
jgi:hypothetical protein